MSDLIKIQGVRGYIGNDGTAYLNLEDVSRGLGFTTVATSGNECVRWSRVEQYLTELGFNKDNGYLPDDTFIPENIFYRLAMKAKNETAEKFQAKVADEILPSIRKTGTYSIQKAESIEDLIIMQAQSMKELRGQVNQLQSTTQTIKDTIIQKPDNWREDLNRMFNRIVRAIGTNEFQELRSESYKLLEERAHVDLNRRLIFYKSRLEQQGISKTKVSQANRLDVIEQDPKLREIYSKIIQEYTIKYVA